MTDLIELLSNFDGLHRGEQGQILRANRRRIIEALEAARNVAVFVLHDQDLECPEAERLLDILHPETP